MWETKKSFWSLGSERSKELLRRLEEAGMDVTMVKNRRPIPGKSWDWETANQILEDVVAGRPTDFEDIDEPDEEDDDKSSKEEKPKPKKKKRRGRPKGSKDSYQRKRAS